MLQNPEKHPLSLVFIYPFVRRTLFSTPVRGKNGAAVGQHFHHGWLTTLATTASTTTRIVLVTELAAHISPLAQAKSGNQGAIAIWAFLTQIGKQTSALPNHQHQPSPRMEVMFMNLKMLGRLIDTPRENGDLYLW